MDHRVFTLEAVNALVPQLSTAVGQQIARRGAIESLVAELGRELGGDVPERIVIDPADPTNVRLLKRLAAESRSMR